MTNSRGTFAIPRSRPRSSASALVAVTECSGLPVTTKSTRHQITGATRTSSRPRTRRPGSRGGPAPQPQQAREDPALRPQEPGEHEQPRGAAPALGLPHGGPHDERQERHVDVRAHRVEQEREARADEERGEQRGPDPEERAAQPPRAPAQRDEAQQRREDEQAVGVLPGEPHERGVGDVERVLGRRRVGLERRLEPVEDLPAPDEVVVGVVVRIARDEQPPQDGGGEEQPTPTTRSARLTAPVPGATVATAAARPVPSASSAQVSGSSRNAAYSSVCTSSAANAAATATRAVVSSPARPIAANSRHSAATRSTR